MRQSRPMSNGALRRLTSLAGALMRGDDAAVRGLLAPEGGVGSETKLGRMGLAKRGKANDG